MALGLAMMEMFGVQGKAYSDTAELYDYNLYYGNWEYQGDHKWTVEGLVFLS